MDKVWVVEERHFGYKDEPDKFTVVGVYKNEQKAFDVVEEELGYRRVHGPYHVE